MRPSVGFLFGRQYTSQQAPIVQARFRCGACSQPTITHERPARPSGPDARRVLCRPNVPVESSCLLFPPVLCGMASSAGAAAGVAAASGGTGTISPNATLKEIVRERLLHDIVSKARPGTGSYCVMVVDYGGMRILSAALKAYDLSDEGVALIESLEKKRQPLPEMTAIYFITPTEASVTTLLNDFAGTPRLYKNAHVFFTSYLPDALQSKLALSPAVHSIVECKVANIDFLAVEQQVFHFDMPDALSRLYAPSSPDRDAILKRCAVQLATVCAQLNEFPFIRYEKASALSTQLARLVSDQLGRIYRSSATAAKVTQTASLLIVDRSADPLTPLLHDFYYQAMVYDLLDVKEGRYTYTYTDRGGKTVQKEVLLDESDPLWPALRHRHVAEAIQHVVHEFERFQRHSESVEKVRGVTSGEITDLSQLRDAIKAMPSYQAMLSKYSLHLSLTENLMKEYEKHKLATVARLEQDMALGVDSEGREVKNVQAAITPLLRDPDLSLLDRQRLLMIYIVSNSGMPEAERRRLMEFAGIGGAEGMAIGNLVHMGVTVDAVKKKKRSRDEVEMARLRQQRRMVDVSYDLSRYVPPLKDLIQDHITNKLSQTTHPYLQAPPETAAAAATEEPPSLRRHHWDWHRRVGGREDEPPAPTMKGPRVLVFVLGGMALSEMRAAYEVTQAMSRQVTIGSTSILTPEQYVRQLRDISLVSATATVSSVPRV